ncbi:MAG: putative toxin-antitoxin system toxin component, PIN family [Verrucomicrobiota bacterium]
MTKRRVVLDTSTVISGIFWRNESYRCLVAFAHRRFLLCVSPPIVEEYTRVAAITRKALMEQGRKTCDQKPWLGWLAAKALWFSPHEFAEPVCRDPKDDTFLECAVSAGATIIVSRDEDLLALEKPFGMEIMTPRAFLSRLAQ